MGSKMLIDAAHPEETRVVVFRGNRIEEFDYESAARKQLKGSIYLAKVTRVEPSLQAAFVDYGGNRHGFLAFSEIHPDYYQIPVADREALLREEEQEAVAEASEGEESDGDAEASDAMEGESDGDDADSEDVADSDNVQTVEEDENGDSFEDVGEEEGAGEEVEQAPVRRRKRQRRYRIQEVIKRRQVILVQVVKEERGNKGAALTTYLSLAGRYCVLMPNTAQGGGISRKINDAKDRKRLKDVVQAINVPEGAGLIVRTAGASRTKAEIKRDFDYLLRLWGNIRDLTLKSTAPSLVYEEGNLIKRSIRDLYNKDVDEVLVEGDQAYKDAKGFMKMLMPSHAKNVKHYTENRPLFSRYQVENQLDALYSPQITLPSGGYLVMNQTEALVAIDINSGRATREHSIESTALKTNLEAAVEIARQLRLRDLAGLVVIDFIDMEERRNNRAVERKLKEALKSDRARIQVGRISHFGLLEMSRQRMRASMLEGTTKPCTHCEGTGLIRSLSSCALSVLRAVEDHLINRKAENLKLRCQREVACYILNEKRDHLRSIETAYDISIYVDPADDISQSDCEILRGAGGKPQGQRDGKKPVNGDSAYQASDENADDDEKSDGRKKRRRRRGRRGRKNNRAETEAQTAEIGENQVASDRAVTDADQADVAPAKADADNAETGESADKPAKKPRKRTRKPRKKAGAEDSATVADSAETGDEPQQEEAADAKDDAATSDKPAAKKKPRKRSARKRTSKTDERDSETPEGQDSAEDAAAEAEKPKRKRTRAKKPSKAKPQADAESTESNETAAADTAPEPAIEPAKEPDRATWNPPEATATDTGPAKKGWWSK